MIVRINADSYEEFVLKRIAKDLQCSLGDLFMALIRPDLEDYLSDHPELRSMYDATQQSKVK